MKRALVVVVGCFALSVVGQRLSAPSSLGRASVLACHR